VELSTSNGGAPGAGDELTSTDEDDPFSAVATLACEPCAVAFDGGAFEAPLFPPPHAARPSMETIAATARLRIAAPRCLLTDELGSDPSPQTEAVYLQILTST